MISYGRRLTFAFRTFFSILNHGGVPSDVALALIARESAGPAPETPPDGGHHAGPPEGGRDAIDPTDRATQMLTLLQRDGRLVDFLMEDLGGYADAQIGAAVRDVHAGCRGALDRYVALGPVLPDAEGQQVTVAAGTDPARIKVVGNAGKPPLRGMLRHRGWEVTRIELPPLPVTGRTIVAPAEVEIQ